MKCRICDDRRSVLAFPYCKNKLTSVFYASVFLLMIHFVITLSKFVVDPQHFDNVMMQLIINKRTDALKKTDVNLLNVGGHLRRKSSSLAMLLKT